MTHVGLVSPEKEDLICSIVFLKDLKVFFFPDYLGCSVHEIFVIGDSNAIYLRKQVQGPLKNYSRPFKIKTVR